MNKPIFDVVAWKKETYRKLLYPGGHLPRFEYKPPPMIYGRTGEDTADDIEADTDLGIDTE